MENKVSERYLTLREQVLRYSYRDMNLSLDNDEQVYLKIQKGIYFKELEGDSKEDRFLLMLMNHVLGAISQIKKGKL